MNLHHLTQKTLPLVAAMVCLLTLPGCAPEVGSARWCDAMQDKPQGEWTFNETADYAKHCLLKSSSD